MKVLILDDEEIICESLQADFYRLNHSVCYETFTANSVKEAEKNYEQENPSIIITDINMPKISGLTFIEKVRKTDQHCIILVLSAYDDFEYVRRAFLSGANDYILKPISFQELDTKLIKYTNLLKKPHTEVNDVCSFRIEDAIRYINENISNDISMSDVSDYVAMSYSHFSKLFREFTRISFPNYLLKVRMEKAKEYLIDPYIKISNIAQKIGYKNNSQHFSRDFNKYTGMSPSEYRWKKIHT